MMCRSVLAIVFLGALNFAVGVVKLDLEQYTVTRGKTFHIICTVDAPDTFSKWTFKGQEITLGKETTEYKLEKIDASNIQLTFKNVQEKMAGKYICASQTSSAVFTLGIEFEFINLKKNQGLIRGTNDVIECAVSGYPKPEVKWYRRGKLLQNNEKYYQEDKGMRVKNVQESDEGYYECRVKQGRKTDERNISVSVYQHVKIDPVKSTLFEYSYANYSEAITLKCVATGKPLPKVIITRDGKQLYGESAPIARPGIYSVQIRTKTADQFGKYICNASNIISSDAKEIILGEAEIPKITRTSLEKIGNLNGDTELECRATGKPSPVITWYGIRKVSGTPVLLIGSRYKIKSDGSLVISETTADDIGKYRCKAKNLRGEVTAKAEIIAVEEPKVGARGGAVACLFQGVTLLFVVLMSTFGTML